MPAAAGRVREALIVCVPDAFANAVKPRHLVEFLARHDVRATSFSTLGLGRWRPSGRGSRLPGPRPSDWLLYALEALLFVSHRLPLAVRRWTYSRCVLPVMRLRARALARALAGRDVDLLVCESNLDVGFVLGGRLAPVQVLDLPAPFAEELYFAGELTRRAYERLRAYEVRAYGAADHLSFHWETYAGWVRATKYDGGNFLPLTYGVEPKAARARWSPTPRIVFLGFLGGSWVNLPLLQRLCDRFPTIDVYGGPAQAVLGDRYKGYAPTLDVLAEYQFGLITIADDPLRRHGFSSKQLEYYSYGLPVLTPAWREDPLLDAAALLYDEESFAALVEKLSTREAWEELSGRALDLAQRCSWEAALAPLAGLLHPAPRP